MALESNLLKFKSSGVKQILEIAESTPTTTLPSGARLLIINSRKGRVNYPVAIRDFSDYKAKFDNINDADERRGNFGARTAQQMLEEGPIYVINLRQFEDSVDTAGIVELSSSTSSANNNVSTKSYKKLFNTQQFWKIDNEALLSATNTDKLLVFGNIGVQALSIFVRKTRVNQFNQTFDTWYTSLSREMPSYVLGTDKVKDWMVDVFVFANNFTNDSTSNASYGFCLDETGNVRKTVVNSSNITVDALTQLASINEANHIGTFTGSLVQGFTDETGNNLDIVDIINSYVEKTGLIIARNEEIYDDAGSQMPSESNKKVVPVDMVGHNIISALELFDGTGKIDFAKITETETTEVVVKELSYDYPVKVADLHTDYTEKSLEVVNNSLVDSDVSATKLPVCFKVDASGNVILNKFYVNGQGFKPSNGDTYVGYDQNLSTVKSVVTIGSTKELTNANNEKLAIQPFGEDVAFADSRSWLASDALASTYVYADAGKEFTKSLGLYVYPVGHPLAGLELAYEKLVKGVATNVLHNPNAVTKNFVLASTSKTSIDDYATLLTQKNAAFTSATVQVVKYSDISTSRINASSDATTLNELLATKFNDEYLYEVTLDKNLATDETVYTTKTFTTGSGQTVSYSNRVGIKINSPENCSIGFSAINLKSYVPRNRQFLDGTAERQNEVLSVLYETSIDNGMQNQDLLDWMYIVDGFKSYIEPNIKYQLRDVAKKRITGRAIYNLPFLKDFNRSTNPYFSEEIGGDLSMKYVAQGGNFELPYSNSFSLPLEDGYFAYGFSSLESRGGKIVPSAGVVSNLFARKHRINKPYGILAGNPDGVLQGQGIVGPEHVFIEKNDGTGDRDYLEPAGWNLILRKSNVLQIYSNKTSFVTVNSPVSSIHTSEVIMFLQLRIKALLEGFVFKYNTVNNRMRIVEQANDICAEPFGAGAISGFMNTMDSVNNNKEIIANRIGVLDTTIYANNGMEIIVHRTNIDMATNTATFEIL